MKFEDVLLIHEISPEDPAYEKPDIGKRCIKKYRQLINWEEVKMCTEHYRNTEWTAISTHMGTSLIDMPYDEVSQRIKDAGERMEKESEELHHRLIDTQKDLTEALAVIIKK